MINTVLRLRMLLVFMLMSLVKTIQPLGNKRMLFPWIVWKTDVLAGQMINTRGIPQLVPRVTFQTEVFKRFPISRRHGAKRLWEKLYEPLSSRCNSGFKFNCKCSSTTRILDRTWPYILLFVVVFCLFVRSFHFYCSFLLIRLFVVVVVVVVYFVYLGSHRVQVASMYHRQLAWGKFVSCSLLLEMKDCSLQSRCCKLYCCDGISVKKKTTYWPESNLVPRVSLLPAPQSERRGREDERPWERGWPESGAGPGFYEKGGYMYKCQSH